MIIILLITILSKLLLQKKITEYIMYIIYITYIITYVIILLYFITYSQCSPSVNIDGTFISTPFNNSANNIYLLTYFYEL